MSLVRDAIAEAFGGRVPHVVTDLLPASDDALDPHVFPAGPVLELGGPGTRAFVADPADPTFLDRARATFPAEVVAFLEEHEGRRMVETDGVTASLTRDDAHHGMPPEQSGLWCDVLRWPDGARIRVTRHAIPPRHLLPDAWVRRVDDLLHAGLVGLVGVRWAGDDVAGLLWVNDARWHGGTERTGQAIDAFADPRWAAQRALARTHGFVAYPDSIEVDAEGRWWVTIGWHDPERPDDGTLTTP